MSGKFLIINSIRKHSINRRGGESSRLFSGGRLAKISRQMAMKHWKTVSHKPSISDANTQTKIRTTKTKATETELYSGIVRTESKPQQTIRKIFQLQGTQTDLVMISQGVQTEQITFDRSIQTEQDHISTASQATAIHSNVQVQTEPQCVCSIPVQTVDEMEEETIERLTNEKDRCIMLLSEIGEMIIHQNKLMQNNATLLHQVADMTIINKEVRARNTEMKQYEIIQKRRLVRRILRKRRRTRYIFYEPDPKETRLNMRKSISRSGHKRSPKNSQNGRKSGSVNSGTE